MLYFSGKMEKTSCKNLPVSSLFDNSAKTSKIRERVGLHTAVDVKLSSLGNHRSL